MLAFRYASAGVRAERAQNETRFNRIELRSVSPIAFFAQRSGLNSA
jgi:hypothetical protein